MDTLWEVVLALLGAGLLAGAGFVWASRLLRPEPWGEHWVLLPGRGDGDDLERAVRGLVWLREMGLLACPVVIADLGLTCVGRERAFLLMARWPQVLLWPVDRLEELARRGETET